MLPEGRNSVPLAVIPETVWRPCWNEGDHVQRLCRVQWTSERCGPESWHRGAPPPAAVGQSTSVSEPQFLACKTERIHSASPRVVLRMKQNKPFGTLVNLCGTCCIPGTVQSTANINEFNAHSSTQCTHTWIRLKIDFAQFMQVKLQELHWPVSQTKTRQCPRFPSTAIKRSRVVLARPTARVFLEGRCSQAGFSNPLLSSWSQKRAVLHRVVPCHVGMHFLHFLSSLPTHVSSQAEGSSVLACFTFCSVSSLHPHSRKKDFVMATYRNTLYAISNKK